MDSHPFYYTHYQYPHVEKYPLHSATYNGRLQKVQSMLKSSEHNIYQMAGNADDYQGTHSALFIAIARRHSTIAHKYLDIVAADLGTIEQHFQRVAPQIALSRFWLCERVLVAFGQEVVDYVLAESHGVLADPQEMGDRRGFVILLKPDNFTSSGVVWLTARRRGADRIIARIIGHIYERGGELNLMRKDRLDVSLFGIAARMNQMPLWQRMFDMFGQHLDRRELAACFRFLADYEPSAEKKTRRFDELCVTVGGFSVDSLYSEGNEVNILYDAILQFKEDSTILDHLIRNAAVTKCIDTVLNQIASNKYGQERSLYDVAFQTMNKKLHKPLLKYEPDMIGGSISYWWETRANSVIVSGDFERTAHDLILEQLHSFGKIDGYRWDLLNALIKYNWADTIREMYLLDPSYEELLCKDRQVGLQTLKMCAENHSYDVLEYLISKHELDPSEKFSLLSSMVGTYKTKFPESIWKTLGKEALADVCKFNDLLCISLQSRNLPIYKHLLTLVPNVSLKDVISSEKENLLFSAIWDKTLVKPFAGMIYGEPESPESPEFIDSEDDDVSSAYKTEANRLRTPPKYAWDELDENESLEQEYQELFQYFLECGLNWKQINATGQNLVHIAVVRVNISALHTLIELGLETNLSDSNGNRPMHLVSSEEFFDLLPTNDVRCVNSTLNTPLLNYLRTTARYKTKEELVRRFVEAGTDVNQANDIGDTALHLTEPACSVKILLDANAKVNVLNTYGETPTYNAFRLHGRNIASLRLLLAHPDQNIFRRHTFTDQSLLLDLVQLSDSEFAKLQTCIDADKLADLISRHCNCTVNDFDDISSNILAYAIPGITNTHCLRALLETVHLNALPLDYFSSRHTDDEGRWLLTCGSHISQRSNKQPLDWSTASGDDFVAHLKMFIAAGANLEITNRIGETALQFYGTQNDADCHNLTRIVAQLLEAGANYRFLTTDGVRALERGVFRSLYDWDEENGESIMQQVFEEKCFW